MVWSITVGIVVRLRGVICRRRGMIGWGIVGWGGSLIGRGVVGWFITRFVASFRSFIVMIVVMGMSVVFLV